MRNLLTNPPKILVCITAQGNSKRLINYGQELAEKSMGGELHVLHVVKGRHIFMEDDSADLLQRLFEYGAARGATIHAICGESIPDNIKKFIRINKMTHLVLGALPLSAPVASEKVYEQIRLTLPYVEIHLLERDE